MPSLFDISKAFQAIYNRLDETGGEISPEDETELSAFMDSLAEAESDKLDGYLAFMDQLTMEAAAARAHAEQWQAKAKTRENRVERLKACLKNHLMATLRTRIDTASGRVIALQKAGGKLPVIIDAGANPLEMDGKYTRTTVEFDKSEIANYLAQGEQLAWAHFGERPTFLKVK